MEILFDARWIGDHGIGRFAHVMDRDIGLPHLRIGGVPSSAFDPLRLLFAMLIRTPKGAGVLNPGYNAPLFLVRPYIFTIHDLNHIDRTENSSLFKRMYYRFIMRRAVCNAFRVLTVSQYSRLRIIEWSGVDAYRVVNVGNGVDASYHTHVVPYAPGYPYLLCVGNRKTHKNEPRVVEAFAQAAIDPGIRLIFTGPINDTLQTLCLKHGVEHRVVFVGNVPEEDFPGLYRGAIALVFPSLYEGFGLPVIEAMACGTPVLTSRTTSLPEVAGDAALLVDPLSVEQISVGVARLCGDDDLRHVLRQRGLQRAALFGWENVITKVKDVLETMRDHAG